MCGFIGCIHDHPQTLDTKTKTQFERMNNRMTHRGPDDEGYYFNEHISFGFRRLSIIDIDNGHQPLSYENERYWIIFNGEIYNHVELREQLKNKGYPFATESDTEVILALYSDMGERVVEKLRGMFGFVIWDKEKQELFGARDPFGIKPFFYHEQDNQTYFASEKKSILMSLNNDVLNYDALQHYLTYQYVPEPDTMSVDIKKLEPGHCFKKKIGEDLNIKKYWQAEFTPVNHTQQELTKEIHDVLFDSVNKHMRSDVPVGSFLSGGIDSSAIVAMAKEFNPNIKTFSVGFERDGYSEVDVAKETAEKLNVENISYLITPEEFLKELPKIIWHLDDPLADPAAIPLYFVAREASNHVSVTLSGEGADELFGGYNIYHEPNSLKGFNHIPKVGKKLLRTIAQQMPQGVKGKSFIERGCTPMEERYIGNAKMFTEKEKQAILKSYKEGLEYTNLVSSHYNATKEYEPVNRMQYIDIHTWLRGDILLKADRMTMAHSLELRVPFLDKEVFRVASKISPAHKIANGTTKHILRKAIEGVVPDHVLNRKKLGFPVPIRHWLKNELYDWAVKLITESQTDHLIRKSEVTKLLEEHCKGTMDHSRKIWTVLIFMVWHQIYMEDVYDFSGEQEKGIILP